MDNYTLLSPVKEDDLRLSFGHKEHIRTNTSPHQVFEPSIQLFKRLAIGKYLWFIADTQHWMTNDCGGDIEQLLGIQEQDLRHQSPQILFSRTHPDDLVHMLTFSNYWVQYFMQLPEERKAHNRATIYIRMLNTENVYNWMMVQYADQLLHENGTILYGLTLLTNIQHIKKDGSAMMSIIDTYDESCQQFICLEGNQIAEDKSPKAQISNREIEVMKLLAKGHSSKQISALLHIAQKTVDNHRQNMLHKTSCHSTAELVAFGITNGYI